MSRLSSAVIPLSSPVIPIRITRFYSALCFFGMAAYRRPLASRPCATVTRFILFHRCQSLDELVCCSVISGLKWRAVASVPFRSYPTHALPMRLSQGSIRAAYDSAPGTVFDASISLYFYLAKPEPPHRSLTTKLTAPSIKRLLGDPALPGQFGHQPVLRRHHLPQQRFFSFC